MRRAALALVLGLLSSPAWGHDFFSGLRSPQGLPCCSGDADTGDCHVTKMCVLPNGQEGIVSVVWGCRPIDWTKVLPAPSPTGEPAICEPPNASPTTTPVAYCILLGASS